MTSLIKYTFLSLKGRLWILLGFMLLSLSSNLFFNFLPEPWNTVTEIIWRIPYFLNYIIVLLIVISASDYLNILCYRQILLKPYTLIVSSSIMLFTVASAFTVSLIGFATLTATIPSDEILLSALLSILYRSLNITSVPLLFLLLSLTITAAKSRVYAAFLTGFSTLLIVIYLWVFPGNLNPFHSMFEPLLFITFNYDSISPDILLFQIPLESLLQKSLIAATALILKISCLSYMLDDKIDI